VKALITGIAGAHAQLVALRLVDAGHEVLGIDVRPWQGAPRGVKIFQTDVRKRPAADVFRVHRPDVVIHMATVTHFNASAEQRYRVNLRGTQAVFRYCEEFGVKEAVFVGRHTIYGAAADAPSGRGTLASFLAGPRVPMVLGFDPLFHVMHEDDAAKAIVLAAQSEIAGVYNVAGPPPVPLSVLCKATGRQAFPMLEGMVPRFLGRFGLPKLPRGAIAHLKHPVVVDDSAFVTATGFEYTWDEHSTMASFRDANILRENRGL